MTVLAFSQYSWQPTPSLFSTDTILLHSSIFYEKTNCPEGKTGGEGFAPAYICQPQGTGRYAAQEEVKEVPLFGAKRVPIQAGSDLPKHVPLLWHALSGIKTTWHVSKHQLHGTSLSMPRGQGLDPAWPSLPAYPIGKALLSALTLLESLGKGAWIIKCFSCWKKYRRVLSVSEEETMRVKN